MIGGSLLASSFANAGFLVGLASEADVLRQAGVPNSKIKVSGMRADIAQSAAKSLFAAGFDPLISFGTAGGLTDDLRPGDLLLPEEIVDETGQVAAVDPKSRALVTNGIPGSKPGRLLALDRGLSSEEEKRAFSSRFLAVAVDMESHHLARAAKLGGRGFLVVDGVTSEIPAFALKAIDDKGKPNLMTMLAGILKNPSTLPSLLHLGRHSTKAHQTLSKAAQYLVS